jgi:effector-binding domain-containing protein
LSADDVVVRAEPAHEIVSLRRTVPSFAAARGLILELRDLARPLLRRGGTPTLLAIAHSPQFEQDEIDVEFGFVLDGMPHDALDPARGLARRTLEPVERMAICVRVGLPEDAHLVTAKIGRYLAASGDVLAGPSREVFLQPPNPERMHESVVEMQFAIRPRDTPNPEAASR